MDSGAQGPLQDWVASNWKLVKKRGKNLRQRMYRATQNGQGNQVRSLTKLRLRSDSNRLLSVRRVTQEHHGKQTAGVDGQRALSPEARGTLVKQRQGYPLGQVKPAKRISMPKAKGKQRPLGMPTITDRVAQAIGKWRRTAYSSQTSSGERWHRSRREPGASAQGMPPTATSDE